MDIVEARQNMIDCQLRTNKVTDVALLSAMGDLPREAFLPVELQAFAYSDGELNIAEGRSMLAPMTSARMLQCLELKEKPLLKFFNCIDERPKSKIIASTSFLRTLSIVLNFKR